MSHDIECPYCGAGQDICHDDGYGYDEDRRHEQQCRSCDKTFVFTTSVSFSYEAEKADCLNGAAHKLEMSSTYPRQYSEMQCKDCDFRRKPTAEEFAAAGIVIEPAPSERGDEGMRAKAYDWAKAYADLAKAEAALGGGAGKGEGR